MEHTAMAKKSFSQAGLAAFAILGVGSLLQVLLIVLMEAVYPRWTEQSWGMWLVTFAPIYLIAVPLGLLILKKVPATPLKQRSMKPKSILVVTIISIFMMYLGNIVGTVIIALLQSVSGIAAGNPILNFAMDGSLFAKLLFMVILGPVIEEYIFRKQLIDRMHIYGGKLAVITSALMFGLFHGNLAQMFYAFTLGLVFGYVYLKTGKLRYSIGLHMLINCIGSIIAPTLLEKSTLTEPVVIETLSEVTPELLWTAALGLYSMAVIGLAIAGLVLTLIYRRKVSFAPAELELPAGTRFKTVYGNPGMILFVLLCLALIVASAILA